MSEIDILVVGGGLAGLTAGLFAARQGRRTLVLVADLPGGHLLNIEAIEDFPGFPSGVAGYELCPLLQEQAANQGAEFQLTTLTHLAPDNNAWLATTSDGPLRARAVIMATGARPRPLGLPGEVELIGRGISHCASCDGPLYRGRTVAVIGGGDSALQEALTLAKHGARVELLCRDDHFTAQAVYQRRVLEQSAITVHWGTTVEAVLGEGCLSGLRVRRPAAATSDELAVAALFVYIGLIPNTELLAGLVTLDATGRVPTDAWLRTSQPGLFAAGEIRVDAAGQAITAAADGAVAALAAHQFLTNSR